MEKLVAFEFISVIDKPQLVRLLNAEKVSVAQFVMTGWLGFDTSPLGLMFEKRADLFIEGFGLGHPYWEGEPLPSWFVHFDSQTEANRLEMIRQATKREVNRIQLVQ